MSNLKSVQRDIENIVVIVIKHFEMNQISVLNNL